jgi:hypothetical protein
MGKNGDELLTEYLIKQHDRQLSNVDSLDAKIAQGIALNGLILSFIFDKSSVLREPILFNTGLVVIMISILLGVVAYQAKQFHDSPNTEFYRDDQSAAHLKIFLINDIDYNQSINKTKAFCFNLMLYFNILGLGTVIVGYYVGR